MPRFDPELEESLVAERKPEVEKPSLYKVLLHNDDFTTMEFVVYVLESIFHHDEATAVQLMLQVHLQGSGIAGVYTREVAEMKIDEVMRLARAHEYPLLCTMEETEA